MTVIGAPPAGPQITDQDAFDEAVRKIKEKFGTEYNYTISHEDAVNAAMGKPTKVKVRTPTLARTSEIAKLTGMWGEGPDAKPTVDYLNTQANQTGMWGMGDAAVPTLKKTGQEFDQGITYGEAMGFNTVDLITATGLIGDFDPPTNAATRKALMGTLRRKYEEVYHNTPTDMQLNTLIDVGELKNVRMTTLAGAELESDIAAGTGTVRGQLTIAGRQMDLTETMSALDAAIAEAGLTGTYTSPDGTISSVETLASKKLQLETAQVSGYLNTGEPVLQLILAEMDIDAQERIVFGYDTYDKYGNLTHTYGTNEIQLVAQRRDVEWQKMKTAGFEYIDPITGDSVHVMGSQELLDHQWTQEEMTRTGYNELQRDLDGNVMYGPGGQPLMRHTMGTQEMDMYQVNLSARLQNKGMDAEDARYYAGLDWQEKQASGFFVIKKKADGTPMLGPDGKPQQQYVRGTSGENDQDRALQRWIISTGRTHEEAMTILRGVQDMEHLNGWDIYNKDTGKIEHVMGTAEWEQHLADRDQVYQNTLLHGGFVTVQAEDGTTYTREIEGSTSMAEKQLLRADTLVRDGWDREDAAAQAAWEREQKEIFGYWTYKDGGHELEWVPGTFETEHDLQIDTLEKQDGMVRYREMLAHVRSTFMLAAQTQDEMELADAQRAWSTIENTANRTHAERMQELDADSRIDFMEWQMEYERTNMLLEAVSGGAFEGGLWLLERIFGGGSDDNPLPDFTDPVAVLAWMSKEGASPATILSFDQYAKAHPELFTGVTPTADTGFTVLGDDGKEIGTFTSKAGADAFIAANPGSTLKGAVVTPTALPFAVLDADGEVLQTFETQAEADAYAATHDNTTVQDNSDVADVIPEGVSPDEIDIEWSKLGKGALIGLMTGLASGALSNTDAFKLWAAENSELANAMDMVSWGAAIKKGYDKYGVPGAFGAAVAHLAVLAIMADHDRSTVGAYVPEQITNFTTITDSDGKQIPNVRGVFVNFVTGEVKIENQLGGIAATIPMEEFFTQQGMGIMPIKDTSLATDAPENATHFIVKVNPDGGTTQMYVDKNGEILSTETTEGVVTPVAEGWMGELDASLEAAEVDRNWLYSITANASDALDTLKETPLDDGLIQLWKDLPKSQRGATDTAKDKYTPNEQRAILGDLNVVFRTQDPTSYAAAKDNYQAEEIVKSTGVSREDLDRITGVLAPASRATLLGKLSRPGYQFTEDDINEIFKDEDGNIAQIGGTTGYLLFWDTFVTSGPVKVKSNVTRDELGA